MLTQEQIIVHIKSGHKKSGCIDRRDFNRLVDFFPAEHWDVLGFELQEGAKAPTPIEWTRDNVVEQLRKDVAFGFEKALDRRGLSAAMMNSTVLMWMWILEDELADCDDYTHYGLPLLKAIAVKYGFPNEIGDDAGDEDKYA